MYSLIKNQLEDRGNGSGQVPRAPGARLCIPLIKNQLEERPEARAGPQGSGGAPVYSFNKDSLRRATGGAGQRRLRSD